MLSKSTFKEPLNVEAKNNITAHILLILFGWLGVHRLYISAKTSGILMLALLVLSVLVLLANLGAAGFVALFFGGSSMFSLSTNLCKSGTQYLPDLRAFRPFKQAYIHPIFPSKMWHLLQNYHS